MKQKGGKRDLCILKEEDKKNILTNEAHAII